MTPNFGSKSIRTPKNWPPRPRASPPWKPVVQDGVEVGYTISFLNTPAITIYHGTKGDKGDTPQIGAAPADHGNWYWTLNGEPLTDAEGNPIRVNGTQGDQGEPGISAPLPKLDTGTKLTEENVTTDTQGDPIEADAVYLSVDGGKTWTHVSGEKGDTGSDGDSFFVNVDTKDPNYVTFTLASGSFQVPRYTGLSLTFDRTSVLLDYSKKANIQCTVTGIDKPTKDNFYLVAVPDGWTASISDGLTVTAPGTDSEGEILVILDNKKGNTAIGRIRVSCGAVGNLQPGDLAELIGNCTDLTSITVTSGTIGDDDWEAIRNNKSSLTYIDLVGATYTGTNAADFVYSKSEVYNLPLQTIKLPQGVTGLGKQAFFGCSTLASVTCQATTPPTLGNKAFNNCSANLKILVPTESVEAYKTAWSAYEDKITSIL